jgi:hypothetical protein
MSTVTRMGRTLAAAALAATTMMAGLTLPAAAAGEQPLSAPMSCTELWESLPQQMKDDITAARSLDDEAQRRAMRVIRLAALRGAYGDRVEELAEARRDKRRELWEAAPEQLKDDVLAARSLPFEEQRRAMWVIRGAALRGVYGEQVQAVAEARRDWLKTCPKVGDTI